MTFLERIVRDVRFGLRVLWRVPVFSVTVVLTLGLVIGATSAVFSLADAVLLRPLPYPDSDRLALVGRMARATGQPTGDSVNGQMWEAVRDGATKVDAAAYSSGGAGVNFVSGGTAIFVQQQRVAAGVFRVLGVSPFMGREFTREEDVPGGPAVAVLSFEFWSRQLEGRANVIGEHILLRGQPFTVVGVMPEGFRGLAEADVWTPLRPSRSGEGGGTNYRIVARLRDGETWASANGELNAIAAVLAGKRESELTNTLGLRPLKDSQTAQSRPALVTLSASVATVLLIACVNIAALLLARGRIRAGEVATRMALGGGRPAIVRQLMIESLLLALMGGALGLLLAYAGLSWLKAIGSATYGDWRLASLDTRTVLATLGMSLATSLAFGLVPALQAGRVNVQAALLAGGSRGIAGSSRHWLGRLLVVSEVALGVSLLVSAGLLMREFVALRSIDPGFVADRLYTTSVSLQDARYADAAEVNRLFDVSLEALRRSPGVSAAAVSQQLPYQTLLNVPFRIEGRAADPSGRPPIADIAYVTPGFFETFTIPIRRGRAIADIDRKGGPEAVVVNQLFADLYFRGEDALGRRLDLSQFGGIASGEIVGISANVQQGGAGFSIPGMHVGPVMATPAIYVPSAQAGASLFRWFSPTWTIRATSAADAAAAFKRAIAAADPLLPVRETRSMAAIVSRATAEQQMLMTLVGVLAGAALLLAAIGIHGVVAHTVSERTREFGIRLALGATPAATMRDVALHGLILAGVGAALGAALSYPAAGLVSSFLTAVTTRDVTTYLGVALLLFVVATLSSVLPALRILRLDPAKTLRQ